MKKVTKAAVAAAAAGVLLLGGAGTFALWSDQADIAAGTVTIGHLTMTSDAGSWKDVSDGGEGVPFAAATDKIVPGDMLEFDQTVNINADGKNLKGKLTVENLDSLPTPADVTVSMAVDATAPGLVEELDGTISFDPGTYAVPVKITVAFSQTATGSMDESLVLGDLAVALTQVR